MSNLQVDRTMKTIDWSQVSAGDLESAIAEFNLRMGRAREMYEEHKEGPEYLERLSHGTPVTMPRIKHTAQLAVALVVKS